MVETLNWSLVRNIRVKHVKACTSDILVQLVFCLKTLEQVVGFLDHGRGGKLCVYCHWARISWYCERVWLKELYPWRKDHTRPSVDLALGAHKLLEGLYYMLSQRTKFRKIWSW